MPEAILSYTKQFDPQRVHRPVAEVREAGDQRQRPVYVYDEEIVLAVNIALATRRPLLVRGPSGCGKSSLARSVADVLKWRYYETVVTSRTQARDLCWEVDLLRRLHDAQRSRKELGHDYTAYVVPRVFWWAFDRTSAVWRGGTPDRKDVAAAADPCREVEHPRAVVLIDEIDKADPDVPNNLLVPLGSLQFQVEETGFPVATTEEKAPLVIITTNDERELPPAFLRRCLELPLDWPTRTRLVEIACAHFGEISPDVIEGIADKMLGPELEKPPEPEQGKAEPRYMISPAEFVDTIRAYSKLEVTPGSKEWELLCRATAWKHGRKGPKS